MAATEGSAITSALHVLARIPIASVAAESGEVRLCSIESSTGHDSDSDAKMHVDRTYELVVHGWPHYLSLYKASVGFSRTHPEMSRSVLIYRMVKWS